MTFPTSPSLSRLVLATATLSALTLCLSTCKDSPEEPTTTSSEEKKSNQPSPEQLAAEKIILEHPNLEQVEVMGEKIYFQNVFTKLGLILPFQDIIDKKFESISGGEAEAAKILTPRPDKTPSTLGKKAHDSTDWGKTPAWIPRYPSAEVLPGAVHAPRKNGSIWGQLSILHKDPIDTIKDWLIKEYTQADMILATNIPQEKSTTLIFQTKEGANEKRRALISLSQRGELAYITIQYSYGMQ